MPPYRGETKPTGPRAGWMGWTPIERGAHPSFGGALDGGWFGSSPYGENPSNQPDHPGRPRSTHPELLQGPRQHAQAEAMTGPSYGGTRLHLVAFHLRGLAMG
jgi:hypothetical protein